MSVLTLANGIDATLDFTSDSIKKAESYDWSVLFVPNGLSGNYKVSIEVSDNNVDWAIYKVDQVVMDYTLNEIIFDSILVGEFFRVKYYANGNTTGTIDITYNIKRR